MLCAIHRHRVGGTVNSLQNEPIAALLDAGASGTELTLPPSLWGFGGVHGGLALALVVRAMQRAAGDRTLRSIHAQFKKPLRDPFVVEVDDEGQGRTVSWIGARAIVHGTATLRASAVFSVGDSGPAHASPAMPDVAQPENCPTVGIPREHAPPFLRRTELRPVGSARPYTGGPKPELTAWLRLVDDDVPPDDSRLIVLMDSLAPSYLAVLRAPVALPTVTYSVSIGSGLAQASSPWILVRARTDLASHDWVYERLDAWAPDGTYLGAGEQLRLVAKESPEHAIPDNRNVSR